MVKPKVSCKFTTIADLLDIDSVALSKESISPHVVKTHFDHLNHVMDHYFYGITLTVHPTFKVGRGPNNQIRTYSPKQQFQKLKPLIEKAYKGFHYIFYTEFTTNGIIHLHGVAAHPLFKQRNSTIETSIKHANCYFGSRNNHPSAMGPVNNWTNWWAYIQKENGFIISSEDFSEGRSELIH